MRERFITGGFGGVWILMVEGTRSGVLGYVQGSI